MTDTVAPCGAGVNDITALRPAGIKITSPFCGPLIGAQCRVQSDSPLDRAQSGKHKKAVFHHRRSLIISRLFNCHTFGPAQICLCFTRGGLKLK